MQAFENVALSVSGRPILVENEIECSMQDNVAIYEGDKQTTFQNGHIALTTHRIVYIDPSKKAIALHLSKIRKIEKKTYLFASPKIVIHVEPLDVRLMLSFRSGGIEKFMEELERLLKQKTWIVEQKQPEKKAFSHTTAGVAGAIKNVEMEDKKTKAALDEAFSDLNSLMDKAREMVAIAEKFAEQLKKAENEADQQEFDNMLVNMGLGSIVTKSSAGALYHQELARQLADFLQKPLERAHGMMLITDAYCLYNRARGTDLISPEDMRRACLLFEKLNISMSVKTFDSGVVVIVSNSLSEDQISKQIQELVEKSPKGYITPVDVANSLDTSIVLAQEHLLLSEQREILCRDETMEGIRFYKNFFKDY
jgi:ESCRT-II complex subunit VPS36